MAKQTVKTIKRTSSRPKNRGPKNKRPRGKRR